MEIGPTIFQIVSNLNIAPSRPAPILQVGQLLNVLVLAKSGTSSATISVDGQHLSAITKTPLEPGQKVVARVEQGGQTPVLRVLPNVAPQLPHKTEVLNQALRQNLPVQRPVSEGFKHLTQISQNSATSLPQPVRTSLAQLTEAIVVPAKVSSPQALSNQIRNSGLFFEAQLQQAIRSPNLLAPLKLDTKARLVQLTQILHQAIATRRSPEAQSRPTARSPGPPKPMFGDSPQASPTFISKPSTSGQTARTQNTQSQQAVKSNAILALEGLVRHAQSALARIETNQVQSLRTHEGPQPSWQIELPMLAANQLHTLSLKINRDTIVARDNTTQFAWSVDVSLEVEDLGPLYARVTLREGQVGAVFWLENEAAASVVAEKLSQLQGNLESSGLHVNQLNCHCGQPPTRKEPLDAMLAVKA